MTLSGADAERLPNKPHGLNSFAHFDDIVFLSSLNPPTDHFRFLQSRGVTAGEVRGFTYFAEAYQAIMRTSLRTPEKRSPKRILVPDRGLAEYLHDVFPGSEVKKLDIGLVEDAPRRRGRPRKHHSNQERLAQQRQKAREHKMQGLGRATSSEFAGCNWRGGLGGRIYRRAEQKVLVLGIRSPLMTIVEEADESIRFAGYVAEGA